MNSLPISNMLALSVDDAARYLATLAKANRWSIADIWNGYENTKYRLTSENRIRYYNIVTKACAIIVWNL